MRPKTILACVTLFLITVLLTSCNNSSSVFNVSCNVAELITAIDNANANTDTTTIHLAEGCIYELTEVALSPGTSGMVQVTGLPPVSTTIIMQGHNATIQRQLGAPHFRIFFVTSSGSLGLHDLSILNGSVINGTYNFAGGGIYVQGGILTLINSHMENNTAESNGGGIYNMGGTVNIDTSTIVSNHAEDGGGIFNYLGTIIVHNSSSVNNNTATESGGGISSYNGDVTIGNSQVNNNQAAIDGGGLYMIKVTTGTPDLIISGATFDGNITNDHGGAIYMEESSFSIFGTTFSNNQASGTPWSSTLSTKGGAIYIQDSKPGTIGGGSLFDTNSTDGGGGAIGIYNYSSADWITIQDTTIQNNTAVTRGGGIDNQRGDLSIINATITGNSEPTQGGGGVYQFDGELLIQDSTISNNTANSSGGGVFVFSSILTMTGSTLQGNQAIMGGGLNNDSNNITSIDNTVFDDNTAQRSGGGIFNGVNSVMTLENSTVSNNHALIVGGEGLGGGGIYNAIQATITISNTTISGNTSNKDGGGVDDNGSMWILQSVIYNNTTAINGGGISTVGMFRLINSTVSGNQTGDSGGGVHVAGSPNDTVIINSTIVHNTSVAPAGGLLANNNASSVFKNIIVAMNTPSDCSGINAASVVGDNLDSDGTCTSFNITADPLIGPLADNGGPTWTHALLPGSPALDAVTDCTDHTSTPLTFDQRYASRPYGAACEIGAYEESPTFVPMPLPIIPATPTPSTYICESILGISLLEDDMIRIQVSTPGLPAGIYEAMAGEFDFSCQTYPEYPDRLFCDGPRGEPGTFSTLIIYDPLGLPFCEQPFGFPSRDVPDEEVNCSKYTTQPTCVANPKCTWSTRSGPCVEK